MTTDRHTLFVMDAAMCMWEEVLSLVQNDPRWQTLVEGCGYGELRLGIRDMAETLEQDWREAEDTYTLCFDWDFVPDWIARNIIIDDEEMRLRPDREIPQP